MEAIEHHNTKKLRQDSTSDTKGLGIFKHDSRKIETLLRLFMQNILRYPLAQ